MEKLVGEEWYNLLKTEFNKPYFVELSRVIKQDKAITYPTKGVFRPLKWCEPSTTKIVIMAEKPYLTRDSTGFAFENVGEHTRTFNMFLTALGLDPDRFYKESALTCLAVEGVLLINRISTINRNNPTKHDGIGWNIFNSKIVEILNTQKQNISFIFIGDMNKDLVSLVDKRHQVAWIESPITALKENREWNYGTAFIDAANFSGINWQDAYIPF